jgi:ABC-type molybdate transport system substrate-binding protein
MVLRILLLAAIGGLLSINLARAEELRVLAAGSLHEAMTAIGDRYRETTGINVTAAFGPSGLLRERIEKGERTDLFASAGIGHPLKLLNDGRATRVAMFVRNTLCGVAIPKVGLTTANFIDRLLDPAVKLGTSTPKADPADFLAVRVSGYGNLGAYVGRGSGGPSTYGVLSRDAKGIRIVVERSGPIRIVSARR